MRKLRDIDAELRALVEKTRRLKSQRLAQLGDLVIATGADALQFEVLAGVLLAAVDNRTAETADAWRRRGEHFFREQEGAASRSASSDRSERDGDGGQNAAGRGPSGAPAV